MQLASMRCFAHACTGLNRAVGRMLPSRLPASLVAQPERRALHVAAVAYAEQAAALPPTPPRTFTQFAVYKGKAAVAFKSIAPTFRERITETNLTNYTVEREGVLFLEFAQAAPGSNATLGRNYDWSNKVTFALKPVELAQLTDLDQLPDASKGVELYHDPNKGTNDPSVVKTSKRLKLVYNPSGDGYLLSITHTRDTQTSNVMVPLTRAEFVVLKHLTSYLIPRMLGFDMLFEGAGAVPTNLAPPDA